MNLSKKIVDLAHKAVIYPISIGHYILTAGDPIQPKWAYRLDMYFVMLSNRMENK